MHQIKFHAKLNIRARLRTELGVSRKELTMHLQQCIVDTSKCVTMHCDTLVNVHNALTCRQAQCIVAYFLLFTMHCCI